MGNDMALPLCHSPIHISCKIDCEFFYFNLAYKTGKFRQFIRLRKISWSMQSGNSSL